MPDISRKTTRAYDGFTPAELQQLEQMFTRQLHNMDQQDPAQ